jgi:hypothetical protein
MPLATYYITPPSFRYMPMAEYKSDFKKKLLKVCVPGSLVLPLPFRSMFHVVIFG